MEDGQLLLEQLWASGGSKGEAVKVALLDTGIDLFHKEFEGRDIVRKDIIDPRGGGEDVDGHGTQCAGIIMRVAPACTLLSIKTLDRSGNFTVDALLSGLAWAASRQANVICICTGERVNDPDLEATIEKLLKSGCVTVAAVGNRGWSGPRAGLYPARCKHSIAVGTAESGGDVSDFTELPADKDVICIPGSEFVVPVPGGDYTTITGTSASAAYLAAVLALSFGSMKQSRKGDELKEFIYGSAAMRDSSRGNYLLLDPIAFLSQAS